MAVAEDASTPAVVRVSANTSATTVTGSYTPPAASLELIMYGIEWATAPGSITTPTISSSAGGAWTAGPLIQASNLSGWLGCWWRYNASAPGAHTTTITRSQTTSAAIMLAARVLTGTDTTLAGSATQQILTTTGNGTQQTLTPVRANSYLACGMAINSSGTETANANTTQWDYVNDTSIGANLGMGRATSLTQPAGSGLSIGWTGITTNNQLWIAIEVWAAVAAAAPARSLASFDRPMKRRVLR